MIVEPPPSPPPHSNNTITTVSCCKVDLPNICTKHNIRTYAEHVRSKDYTRAQSCKRQYPSLFVIMSKLMTMLHTTTHFLTLPLSPPLFPTPFPHPLLPSNILGIPRIVKYSVLA